MLAGVFPRASCAMLATDQREGSKRHCSPGLTTTQLQETLSHRWCTPCNALSRKPRMSSIDMLWVVELPLPASITCLSLPVCYPVDGVDTSVLPRKHVHGAKQGSNELESGEFCNKTKLNTRGYPCRPGMSIAVIAGNRAFPPLSGCAMNPRFEHPVFHPMICYFKGFFACATSRATLNVPPDQCDERVLAPAFLVRHCLSQVSEYMCTIATLPLVTASLILGQMTVLPHV
jgi:hypothetical protein